MEEIDVPPFFLCPISLEIMKDPVTVSTGITYDRESIEKWLFSGKNNTCPATKQVLSADSDLTPNHTLRRLIQAWCTLNASNGVERIPTPKIPINKVQIVKLLNDAKSPQLQMKCIGKLRALAAESDANKRCIESAGAVEFLASIVSKANFTTFEEESDKGLESRSASSEALSILHYLQVSEAGLEKLVGKNGEFVGCLDHISHQATKATLKLLIEVCPWGRNKVKAVEAGAVSILTELLLASSEKRACEMILTVLDQLCGCAEGRAELLKHAAGMAIVSKKILRVSHVASERAVKILYSISKFSATPSVLQEMSQLGVVAKLCLVLQVDCGSRTKEKSRDILRLHARAWKNSPCIPTNLLSSYP
uniref:U-box domain-containing protein n=1 Tax=Vitis vinifera TaxID=29760 RepID=A5B995_VITVI|nr:hypothetical protein VITISV_023329 [Vitis vinifera]